MKLEKHHYFFLFVGFLFLGIVSINLFSDGMFLDGLLYADISRNMSEGLGSFWKPHLSNSLFKEFYEHPPLALGLQSLAFSVFGDSIFVERFYSLFTSIIVGYLIVLIWEKLTNSKKNAWIPLFLWITTNTITWATENNLLENTMNIFVYLSVLFYFNSLEKKRILWLILSGFSLSLGVLSKGFFCLYIWGMPFFMWIFKRKNSFVQMFIETTIIISATVFPIAFLYLFVPEAQYSMTNYFNKQVVRSIKSVKTVDSRFTIVKMFFHNILVPIIFATILIFVALKKKIKKSLFLKNINTSLLLLAIVFSGIFPIMISMKQRAFYILSVYPLFAIALAYYLYPIIKIFIDKININSKGFKIFKGVSISFIIISIALSFAQINRVGREKEMVYDSKEVIHIIGKNKTINICPEMYNIWSLHGYFSRYGNISLDENQENICEYYLAVDDCNKEILDNNYDLVPIKTLKYKLYKRKEKKSNNYAN